MKTIYRNKKANQYKNRNISFNREKFMNDLLKDFDELTQNDIAIELGTAQSQVSRLLRGKQDPWITTFWAFIQSTGNNPEKYFIESIE